MNIAKRLLGIVLTLALAVLLAQGQQDESKGSKTSGDKSTQTETKKAHKGGKKGHKGGKKSKKSSTGGPPCGGTPGCK